MRQLRPARGPAQSIARAGASKDFNHSILFAHSVMFFALFPLLFLSFPCTKYSVFYPRNTISSTTFISLQGWTQDFAWSISGLRSTIAAHDSPLDPGKHLDIWKSCSDTRTPLSSGQRRHSRTRLKQLPAIFTKTEPSDCEWLNLIDRKQTTSVRITQDENQPETGV